MHQSNSILKTLFIAMALSASSVAMAAGNSSSDANATDTNAADTNENATDTADESDGSIVNAGAIVTNDVPVQLAYSAAGVLRAQAQVPTDSRIPTSLLAGAHCIGVFPVVFKEGLIVAAKHGDGIVTCRGNSGDWDNAAPVFFGLSGGSIGLQAGAKITRVVMLFMSGDAVDNLADGRIKIGVNVSATAGPTGANASIHTAPAGIVIYRLANSGGFVGAQIKGTRLAPDEEVNHRVYGNDATAKDLLTGPHQVPEALQVFSKALADYAPASNYNPDMKISGY